MTMLKKHPVGEVRPSQLLLTCGVGSIIDLPHLSALIFELVYPRRWRSPWSAY
jgi:hypothetical protein